MNSVADYIQQHGEWDSALTLLTDLLNQSKLTLSIKWGAPVYTLSNANIVGVAGFKNHVGLWFFQCALLTDPNNRLVNAQEGKTQAMRQWRFSHIDEISTHQQEITYYINEAISNHEKGLKVVSKAPQKPVIKAPQLQQALADDLSLHAKFNGLPAYKQKEFHEYIVTAKREATKQNRLQKSLNLIANQTGLNDKYRNC